MKLLPLGAALSLSLAACAPTPEPPPVAQVATGEAGCALRGGTMQRVGRLQSLQCVVRYADAGKTCSDGDHCQGDCRIEGNNDLARGATVTGQCQPTSNRFGCHTIVEDGRAQATLCVD